MPETELLRAPPASVCSEPLPVFRGLTLALLLEARAAAVLERGEAAAVADQDEAEEDEDQGDAGSGDEGNEERRIVDKVDSLGDRALQDFVEGLLVLGGGVGYRSSRRVS